MATDMQSTAKGAGFLITPVTKAQFLTPEKFDDEQQAVRELARTFTERETLPKSDAIDHQEEGLLKSLLRKAGEQGILGVDVPEEFGGQDLGLVYSAIIASEQAEGSFAVAMGTQTTIGLLPIVYYGNDEQKARFLPKMVTGETVSCYMLTEPGAGSDAMNIKTRAELAPDGKHYILNGVKQWISNGGFADIGIAFAKINDTQFTGFIVDMKSPGIRLGAEEKKMGIKGSSTRAVFFENVEVPVENVLGEIGRGHKIAFNILNIGRLKLGVGGVSAARRALNLSAEYAHTRKAFGKTIDQFGLIQLKLATMAAETYAIEAMGFRVASDIEHTRAAAGENKQAQINAVEEFAIEASIAKVYGSEAVGRVVDDGVQIFGGNGFMQEYPIEKGYRDARITRIFEGTNEINRLLAAGTLFDRVMKNKVDLFGLFNEVDPQIQAGESPDFAADDTPTELRSAVNALEHAKRAAVYTAMKASMKYMMTLKEEEEFLGNVGDMLIYLYVLDSVIGRALHATRAGDAKAKIHTQFANFNTMRLLPFIRVSAERILQDALEGEDREKELKLTRAYFADVDASYTALSRALAEAVIQNGVYPL